MKNIQKSDTKYIKRKKKIYKNYALLSIIFFIIIFVLLMDHILPREISPKKENIKDTQTELLDRKSFEKGKSVGRNAMLQYVLINTDDTLSIEIIDLLALEDTLSKKYKFK